MSDTPFLSVVVPVRNEARFITSLVRSILTQQYPPERFEIIVADGMSDDGTREALAELQRTCPQVQVVDNPKRIVPTGLNLAIGRARGDVVVRIDGHAEVAPDFLAQNAALLAIHPEAWSVGGPIRHAAKTVFGRAVAVAMSHPMGVGNAAHRYPNYEGYVEGAQFPAIRRWVFDRIGGFDERLVRNQDDEFNFRMRQAGGQIYVSPKIRYLYYVRERVGQLFKQYFQYGFWRIPVMEKHRRPTTLRQVVPTLFYVVCLIAAVVAVLMGRPWWGVAMPGAYAAALVAASVAAMPKAGVKVAMCLPLAIATMHAGYGWGLGYGLWARMFSTRAWDEPGRMAALSR